jgi:hypothetical protein
MMSDSKSSMIDEHERDYNRRLERYEFTNGKSHSELIRKINTRSSKN